MRTLLTILLISISLAATPTVFAAGESRGQQLLLAQGGGKTLNEAVEQVRRQCNCRIVSAETRVKSGREVHHIKYLTNNGKVKTAKVNGKKRNNG